jgi:mannose-6-phosphate isomerase-like protein (cupin superfamily)
VHRPSVLPAAALCAAAVLAGCSPVSTRQSATSSASASHVAPGAGLILGASEGERRVRRPRSSDPAALTAPFILKVDERNGGSHDLVMGYEDIPPGESIRPHQHLVADEIIFVHRGSGIATLGTRQGPISAGSTIYIPRNTRVSLRNTGSEPLGIAFIFSRPGFEQLMRENSVLEGETPTVVSPEEAAEIRARHRWHTVNDQP